MVMEVVYEDMGEGMQCTNHPYKNSTPSPGGICAFCLQEKLGKLVSSSFPVAVFPSSSSSSSASFRSDVAANGINVVNDTQRSHIINGSSSSVIKPPIGGNDFNNYHGNYYTKRRSRLPFVLTHRRKKNKKDGVAVSSSDSTSIVFKRSKSTTTPRRRGMHFFDERYGEDNYNSPLKRGFWSFLYLSKHHEKNSSKDLSFTPATHGTVSSTTATPVAPSSVNVAVNGIVAINSRDKKRDELVVVVDENVTPDQASYDRQVSRSRSVGCGSRSFSGDFFERISTGFGDCTLRRVESQREGRAKVQSSPHRNNGNRVRCGGIFSGFMINSSSSSYWVSNSTDHDVHNVNNKSISASAHSNMRSSPSHGRGRSWGWALTSPIRAFSKTSAAKRDSAASNKNVTPKLAAIPSLLAVSG